MKNKIIALTISLMFMTTVVSSKEGKVGFGVDAGYLWADIKADQTAQDLANLTRNTVTYSYDKAALSGRVYLDYGITKATAVELGFFKSGDLNATYSIPSASAKEAYSVQGFDLTAVYQPDSNGFFGKAGIHHSKIDWNGSVTLGSTTYNVPSTNESGTSWLAGLGYEQKIDEKMSYRLGFTYMKDAGGVSGADLKFIYVGLKF
jgi:hypothetical protein